jgi:hypothetical protein
MGDEASGYASRSCMKRDRKALFDQIRRAGHPDAVALVARLGENAIANPEALLAWGSVDDPTFERPSQPPMVERDPIQ